MVMVRPIDRLGLGPTRKIVQLGPEEWEVHVTPPAFMNLPTQTVKLNKDQYLGYLAWENGQLIQDALPDLTPAQREIIMTGIGPDDFDRMFEEDK